MNYVTRPDFVMFVLGSILDFVVGIHSFSWKTYYLICCFLYFRSLRFARFFGVLFCTNCVLFSSSLLHKFYFCPVRVEKEKIKRSFWGFSRVFYNYFLPNTKAGAIGQFSTGGVRTTFANGNNDTKSREARKGDGINLSRPRPLSRRTRDVYRIQ